MKKAFRDHIEETLHNLKHGLKTDFSHEMSATLHNGVKIKLFVVTKNLLKEPATIRRLALWRGKASTFFPSQFPVTIAGTGKWAQEQLLNKKDRILFFFQNEDEKKPFGHAGFYRFDYIEKSGELDNIIRGRKTEQTKGGMTVGLQELIAWGFTNLGLRKIYLRVFSDNERAIALYKRLGFTEVARIPIMRYRSGNTILWKEIPKGQRRKSKRWFVKMVLLQQ